jgi:ribonuclease J
MVTTFASSVHRLNIVLQLAYKHGRKVVVVGRSMLNVIAHARNLGYIKCPDEVFEPMKNLRRLPDDKVVILTTGSQGEPLAAMTRISNKEHRDIRVKQGDTIVFSANPIPGNTIAVVNCIDRLMMQGANVIYGRNQGIHVSGHGAQEDHKLMLALTKPKFFVPVHGEHRMLVQHAKIAQSLGIPEENMVIIDNGDVIQLNEKAIRVSGKVSSGIELVDRAGVVHEHIMKERQQLAEDGVITIVATVNSEGKLMTEPEINLRGVVTKVERSLFEKVMLREVARIIENRSQDFVETNQNGETEVNWTNLRIDIESSLQRLARRELHTYPLLIFLLQNIGDSTVSSSNTIGRRRRRSTASVAS